MLSVYRDAVVLFTNPIGIIEDLRNARKHDRVVVCDVAIDISQATRLKSSLDEIAAEKEAVYIDHHPRPGASRRRGWCTASTHAARCWRSTISVMRWTRT